MLNCASCVHHFVDNWEDGPDDSGTYSYCLKQDREITHYWHILYPTPNWCPFMLGSYKGNTTASNPVNVGSIPTPQRQN